MSTVKKIRERNGFKQEDMAKLLNISPANYSKKENGTVKYSLPEAKILADFFQTTIEALFFENEVSKNDT